jgi:hypothetical protein
MINFQDEIKNLVKSKLWKIHIYWVFIQQWLTQNMWSIGELYVFLITSCEIFHSKILSYEKMEKTKKDS